MAAVKQKGLSDPARWIVIYPLFIDSKKTQAEGRRIPQSAGVESPTALEIHDVLAATGLNPVLEKTKMHPRCQDREPENLGRVRVQLKNDDGTPKNPLYQTRSSILKHVAEMIPKLKTRQPGYVNVPATGVATTAAKKKGKKK